MEPPSKKLKLGHAPYDDDEEEANQDELSMSPTQFDARQDPLYELDKGRAKAATRLKSAFERIFEKYERDFTGVGDEIDLETGEVVINNGHLQSLEDEKVRAREGSIASNDEERITRTKDVGPVAKAKSKSLVKTTSSTNHSGRDYPARSNQNGIVNGAHNHSSFGMPSNPYNSPNPAMFGLPMFNNGPSDPLWQTPEIPIPYHQDMFGLMGHAMGYPPSPGYGYASMLAPGGYGAGMLDGLTHHRVSSKLPYVKTPKRQSLAHAMPIEDDSEEDDVLLGSTTQETQAASTASKPGTSPPVQTKDVHANQMHVKQNDTTTSETTSEKPRRGRGRPKKDSSPAKAQEPIEESEKCSENKATDPTPDPAIEVMTSSVTTSVSQLSSGKESTLAKQIMVKLAQIRASIPHDTASLYSQSRESSQSRKPVEASDEISRVPSSEASDTSFSTAKANNDTSEALPERTIPPTEDVVSGDYSSEESMAVQLDLAKEAHVDKEADAEPEATTQSQEDRNEPSTNQTEMEPDHASNENSPHTGNAEGDAADLFFTAENSQEPEISYPSQDSTTKEPERLPNDKEAAPHNKLKLFEDIQEIGVYHTLQDLDQDICSNQGEHQVASSGNQTAKDTDLIEGTEVASNDPVVNRIVNTLEATHESDIAFNSSQELTQSPLRTESEEISTQLSEIQQRRDTPLHATIMEPGVLTEDTPLTIPTSCGTYPFCFKNNSPLLTDRTEKTDPILPSTKPAYHEKDAPLSNNLTETACEIRCGAHIECKEACQSKQAHEPEIGKPQSSHAERIEVTFRQPPAHTGPSPGCEQNSPDSLPGSGWGFPNPRPIPSTPKKRQEPGPAEPGSRSRLSTPAKKSYPLADLIPALDDEDELSLLSSDVQSSPFSFDSFHTKPDHTKPKDSRNSGWLSASNSSEKKTPRRTGRHHAYLEGSGYSTNDKHQQILQQMRGHTPRRLPFTESRAGKKRAFNAVSNGPQSSPLARTAVTRNLDLDVLTSTPSRRLSKHKNKAVVELEEESDGVRTPGGTVRKCGVDGFVCDRDFCFTCCR
ncbi:hypothetical protein F4821DRAFT_281509 [Hypoxylon rubiginosum]|uniref:Uncharacterized protein n=1 Tax=Hypoxylon rubiginosum TaxID=110542 RepID=A0ACC0CQG6_9PEZI|nr:hypothetical protein F4821DRAFT_281509 [Hypoxylon rubiginosum]